MNGSGKKSAHGLVNGSVNGLEKERIRKNVIASLPAEEQLGEQELYRRIDKEILRMDKEAYIRIQAKRALRRTIYNSMRKLDVLQDLMEDEEITEIMVNGPDRIFTEKEGRLFETELRFESKERLMDVARQIASDGNRMVNESHPILDVRGNEGQRVNIVMPPIALDGPIITIRKFPKEPLSMEKLGRMGAISEEADHFLKKLVQSRYSMLVAGGTGSGKTTFLNILSNYIPEDERIITVEDSAELQILGVRNLVRMEAKNANVEGKGEITIRDMIKSALRMRPDRIVVGEIRDATAIDMLSALNTGHEGFSTVHANSPEDTIRRLEMLVLMGMEIPIEAIRRQIASALDLIVFLGRLRDHSRKVLSISEVLEDEERQVRLNPLYVFEENGEEDGRVLGNLRRTENPFEGVDKCRQAGILLNEKELGVC